MSYSKNYNHDFHSWEEVCSRFKMAGHPIKGRGAGANGKGQCQCLLHDDTDPSMTVTLEDGKPLVTCHAGCDQKSLFERTIEIIGNGSTKSAPVRTPARKVVPIKPVKDFTPEWNKYSESGDQSKYTYCISKGVKAHGLRLSQRGNDCVPMRANGGTGGIVGIQEMNAEYRWGTRNKNSLDGSEKMGSAHLIGDLQEGCKIIVCEGYATAASVYEATQIVSACAFGMGNLIHVAEELLSQGYDVCISPDDDKKGHKARDEAQSKGIRVIIPSFENTGRGENDNDWNDLARLKQPEGHQEVARQIQKGLEAPLPMVEKKPEKEKKNATYEDYINLLKTIYPDKKPRKDLVSGRLMVFNKDQWCPVATKGGNVLYELESITRDDKFYSHTALIPHYKRYEYSLDGELLLDFEVWDGIDRLRVLTDCLNAECFTKEQVYELIVDWLINAYRKALDPQIQNRVLLLQGVQGAGKDKWNSVLSAIFSGSKWAPNRELTSGYISNLTIKPNMAEEDWARAMCSSVIVNVSEFDKIKGGQATFKSIVTASTASWTPKYVEDLTTRLVRASIIASMNPKDINADPSGARRYLVIELKGKPHDQCQKGEVPAILWKYEEIASETNQLLAQVVHMSQEWGGLSQPTLNALRDVQARLTPVDEIEAAIEELFDSIHDPNSGPKADLCLAPQQKIAIAGEPVECRFLTNKTLTPLIDKAAEGNGVSSKAIRTRLKNLGYEKRGTGGVRGFYVPEPQKANTLSAAEPENEADPT